MQLFSELQKIDKKERDLTIQHCFRRETDAYEIYIGMRAGFNQNIWGAAE